MPDEISQVRPQSNLENTLFICGRPDGSKLHPPIVPSSDDASSDPEARRGLLVMNDCFKSRGSEDVSNVLKIYKEEVDRLAPPRDRMKFRGSDLDRTP